MNAVIKYPGAKWSYAQWIISHFPPHKFYLEPFFGSGAVFFNKQPTYYETINDIDGLVVNFFKACRDYPDELAQAIYFTPFSRQEFESVLEDRAGDEIKLTGDCVEDARRFLVRCSQGFGSKLAGRVGWKNTKHSAGPSNAEVWSKLPQIIYRVANRLKNAQIENADAIQMITDYYAKDCLIYADPPYLGETRNGVRIYKHEMMSATDHERLLNALLKHSGPVILSGYENDMYNDMLRGWHKDTRTGLANSSAKRTEVLWMNFETQLSLFR